MATKKSLRILMAEDSVDDFDLVVRALVRGGYEVEAVRVDDAPTMRAALAAGAWDAVFSDWSMPAFSAMEAFALVKESGLDVPFLIVSGTVGDEIAVEALRAGAHDFLTKDKLARLVPAIARELGEVTVRRERNKMREQLMISDRMASIGVMAAGVAHEINNPLAAVIANLGLAIADLDRLVPATAAPAVVAELREELEDARAAADRVHKIVRDLKVFSSSASERLGAIELRGVLESTLRMLSNELRHRARIVLELGPVPPVQGSESRLGQVFLNLIVNAAQAIPEGRAEDNQITIKADVDAGRARVTIEDTGPGIAPEVMRQLFTPFVTTKPPGQGTGLGLSICHRIVSELGGEITVDSRPGTGTRVVVRLPLSATPVTTAARTRPLSRPPARRGTILVIDDERMVATALQRVLSRDHDVTALTRAREAIDRIHAGERFDVIVSDLMMPDVTGMDLHDELVALAPAQADAMVFLTGGAFTARARSFLDRVPNPRLEKPFNSDELRRIINDRVR